MRREVGRIAAQLEVFSTEFVVVANPDHPFLFRNPDILVAHAGNLAAIFVPDATERTNPDILLARYIAARLALPPTAKFVAVDPQSNTTNVRLQAAFSQFHFHTTLDEVQRLSQFLFHEFEHIGVQVNVFPIRLRDQLMHVSQACFEVSEQQLGRQQIGEVETIADKIMSSSSFEPASTNSWTAERSNEFGRKHIRFRSLYSLEDERFAVSWQVFRRTHSLVAEIKEHCTRTLQYVFTLDNGVPYPRPVGFLLGQDSTAYCTFLLVDEVPVRVYDPLWSIRVLSFSRVCLLVASNLNDIWEARSQIIERTEALTSGNS